MTHDDDDHLGADVLTLDPGKPRPPVSVRRRPAETCPHRGVEVDEDLRRVYCVTCGEQLDPVQVLIEQAHGYRSVNWRVAELERLEKRDEERRTRRRSKRPVSP